MVFTIVGLGPGQVCQMVYIFPNLNSLFGYILEGLVIENVGTFCGHLKYFTTIQYVLWPFGIFVVIW
jgi:hypothetical protein